MKQINWKIRFKSKPFVFGIVSALLILAQQIANLLGVDFDEALSQEVIGIVNTTLGILVAVGVLSDPTTEGLKDSDRALEYKELGK